MENKIMTNNQLHTSQIEHRIIKELFLSIYFNDIERTIALKNKYPEVYLHRHNTIILDEGDEINIDLTNLTLLNKTIWNSTDWLNKIMPIVHKNQVKTEKMLHFWHTELKEENMPKKIIYNKYCDFFYCNDSNEKAEIFDKPLSYYLKKGFREIDVKLFNHAQCFDFEKTKLLLEKAANPNISFIENESNSSIKNRILVEYSFLSTCQVIPNFKKFEEKGYNQNFNIIDMFGDLLGLAAFQEMYYLLEKYKKIE